MKTASPIRRAGLAAALLLASATAAAPAGPQADEIVPFAGDEDRFDGVKVDWRDGSGTLLGQSIVLYDVREIAGRAAVCGLYMSRGAPPGDRLEAALAGGRVMAAGQVLAEGLGYFLEATRDMAPGDLRAACRVSGLAWEPAYGRQKPRLVLEGVPRSP